MTEEWAMFEILGVLLVGSIAPNSLSELIPISAKKAFWDRAGVV
jgi:hypothetical protein